MKVKTCHKHVLLSDRLSLYWLNWWRWWESNPRLVSMMRRATTSYSLP